MCIRARVHGEFGTFCHRAGHDGGSRCAEYSLEYQETVSGKPAAVVEREGEEMGHPYESACTEHQSETDERVEQAAKHEVNEVLHHDMGDVYKRQMYSMSGASLVASRLSFTGIFSK